MADDEYPRRVVLDGREIRVKFVLDPESLLRLQVHPDDWANLINAIIAKPEGIKMVVDYILWNEGS